jgi:DNA invertase Pin-like site-specific DNA recombinase
MAKRRVIPVKTMPDAATLAAIAQRAVLYIRVSTPQQERGYSPAFQEKRGRELADREHLHIFEVVYEQVSGTKEHRDGIERVHEILETPEAGNIITYAVDRLGRGGWEAGYYAQRWLKAEARIWDSKSQRERCTTDEDLLLFGIESVFAGNEHRKITSRIRDGLQERQEQGHPNPHVPYGYVYVRDYNNPADKGTAVIVEEQARWVRWMFPQSLAGWSCQRIAAELTRLGIARPPSKGAPQRLPASVWTRGKVASLLHQDAYHGTNNEHRWGYTPAQKKRGVNEQTGIPFPPIVDMATWHAVQRRLDKACRFTRKEDAGDCLLTGRLWCGVCGHIMGRQISNYKWLHYRCRLDTQQAHALGLYHVTASCAAGPLDAAVWAVMTRLLTSPDLFRQAFLTRQALDPQRTEREHLEAMCATLRARDAQCAAEEQQMLTLVRTSRTPLVAAEQELARLQAQRQELATELTRCTRAFTALQSTPQVTLDAIETLQAKYVASLHAHTLADKRECLAAFAIQVRWYGDGRPFELQGQLPLPHDIPTFLHWVDGEVTFPPPLRWYPGESVTA